MIIIRSPFCNYIYDRKLVKAHFKIHCESAIHQHCTILTLYTVSQKKPKLLNFVYIFDIKSTRCKKCGYLLHYFCEVVQQRKSGEVVDFMKNIIKIGQRKSNTLQNQAPCFLAHSVYLQINDINSAPLREATDVVWRLLYAGSRKLWQHNLRLKVASHLP